MIDKAHRAGSTPRRGGLRALPSLSAVFVVALCAVAPMAWLALPPSPVTPPVPAAIPVATADRAWQALAAQLPPPEASPAPIIARDSGRFETSVVRLARGETLASLLADLDLDSREVARVIAALKPHLDTRRLQVGQSLQVTLDRSAPGDDPTLHGLTIRPEPRRQITLERLDSGDYQATERVFEVLKGFRNVEDAIRESLIASAQRGGLPQGALQDLLRAFAWDVSFEHDLKAGDRFAALVEQLRTEDGMPVGGGRLLWARLTAQGGRNSYSVYRFKPATGREFFYTAAGESVVRALLRTPLDLARLTVSSAFGMRRHPLLGFTRLHAGVDFAAPPGTPVLAAGDGRIVQAGRNGGYGNWVQIAHGGVLSTGYAHLRNIASGIRRGARVLQNQVIGFVGSTGLSTGPHLHFELRRNGRLVDPLSVAQRSVRSRLAGRDLDRFRRAVAEIDRLRSADDNL